MPDNFDIHKFFDAVIKKDAEKLRTFFEPHASIFFGNTNEHFTVDEYIRVTCESPGELHGRIDDFFVNKGHKHDLKMVFEALVRNADNITMSLVIFIAFDTYSEDERIEYLTEYWCDIGEPPEWRKKMNIGKRYSDEDLWRSMQ